jgi:hypothetical protein
MIEQLHDLCEQIGGFCRANGNFQRQVAFDLRDKDKTKITLMEMADIIQTASDRYSRMYDVDFRSTGLSQKDKEWLDAYVAWVQKGTEV